MSTLAPSSVKSSAATNSPTSEFSAVTSKLLAAWLNASALKGGAKARAVDGVKVQGCALITAAESNSILRSASCAVETVTTTRGETEIAVQTHSCLAVIKAIVFGGSLTGSVKLAK